MDKIEKWRSSNFIVLKNAPLDVSLLAELTMSVDFSNLELLHQEAGRLF